MSVERQALPVAARDRRRESTTHWASLGEGERTRVMHNGPVASRAASTEGITLLERGSRRADGGRGCRVDSGSSRPDLSRRCPRRRMLVTQSSRTRP